jgi:hypothetical protein
MFSFSCVELEADFEAIFVEVGFLPGFNVMITIFGLFRPFSGKMAFFF